MVQGSLNLNITFLDEKLWNRKMPIKSVKNENFEKQKNVFLSHVPTITQPKN